MKSLPYKYKLTAFVQIFVLLALICLGIVSFRKITNIIETEMGMRAQGIALAASHLITYRVDEYLQLKSVKNENQPFYLEMKKAFQEFKVSNKLRYMYTEKRINEGSIAYVLDAEPPNSEYASHIGDRDNMNKLRYRAYNSRKPEYGPLTDDPVWGKFVTGYAPIINPKNGQFLGLIGVDIEAAEVFKLFDNLKWAIVITISIIFSVIFAITFKLAELMARPLFQDGLTGIHNHKFFQESLQSEIKRVERTGKPLFVLMIDLDNFKYINDSYGHSFGDLILKSTAKILKDNMRSGDVLARYGGEEFTAIISGVDINEACMLASRLREQVEKHSVKCNQAGLDVSVTVSIGIAGWTPGLTRGELIDRADKAMYQSKYRDKNAVTVYFDDVFSQVSVTQEIE